MPTSDKKQEAPAYDQMMLGRVHSSSSAMFNFPYARRYEFRNVLDLAEIKEGHVVVDYPAGRGYLWPYLDVHIELISFDNAEPFLVGGRDGRGEQRKSYSKPNRIPLESHTVNRLLSLAGIHHIANRRPFYKEAHRVLKPGGLLLIGEVSTGSMVGRFLNEFVDRYASSGHSGNFLGPETIDELRQSGFRNANAERRSYPWVFDSVDDMVDFCKRLFILDRATPEDVLVGLKRYLDYAGVNDEIHLNWELTYFKAQK